MQPRAIGVGPDPHPADPAEPEPRAAADRDRRRRLTVRIVAANQTRTDSRLELRGPRDVSSGPIPANSPGTLQTDLPTGTYAVAAADIPGARLGKLVVGPYRASSENDVLLP